MNQALEALAAEIGLARDEHATLRLQFGHACVARVRHLLESDEVLACLDLLARYLAGQASIGELAQARADAERLANGHPGSRSIDGVGHAAVSATYAVAKALQGKALEAASYAAYAIVYAGGGYAAVAHRDSFEPEFSWQVEALRTLHASTSLTR